MKNLIRLAISSVFTLIFIFLRPVIDAFNTEPEGFQKFLYEHNQVFLTIFLAWAFIELLKLVKKVFLKRYDISIEDNLSSRKVHTQVNILERVIIFVIVLLSIGMVLLSFESIRKACFAINIFYRKAISELDKNNCRINWIKIH